MKQIISFKKELPFKTKVSDITSISLERELKVEDDGIVTGVFHITGDYKMNEGSINREEFSFDLPFDITLDPRYDIHTVKSDIEDFYYDVINSDTLKVNIDLFVEAEYLSEPIKDEAEETLEEDILNINSIEVEEGDRAKTQEVCDMSGLEKKPIDEFKVEEVKLEELPNVEREEIDKIKCQLLEQNRLEESFDRFTTETNENGDILVYGIKLVKVYKNKGDKNEETSD